MMSETIQQNDQLGVGLDPDSEEMQLVLNSLQANILMFHGRRQAYHLFLRFPEDTATNMGTQRKIKEWIRACVPDASATQNLPPAKDPQYRITSAAKQLNDVAERRKNSKYTGGLLGCFFLSAAGYQALGYSKEQFQDSSFIKGMGNNGEDRYNSESDGLTTILNRDPLTKNRQGFYRDEIHAMLLFARNDDEIDLKKTEVLLRESLEGVADVVGVEYGRRLLQNRKDLEPFGFRDGISIPSFFSGITEANPKGKIDFSLAEELVLVHDPLAPENRNHCYGSYLVFRKIEQHVAAFKALVKQLAQGEGEEAERLAEARIVGRFKDGTPLSRFAKQDLESDIIDFNSGNDDHVCPLNAHIRKVNRRDKNDQIRRIVRRGIPYNEIETHTGDGVGLLFMCYQRSIKEQFEYIQRLWIDNRSHPVANTGFDRLVGQDWSIEEGKRLTTLQGGEYFFAPSLNFLKTIE